MKPTNTLKDSIQTIGRKKWRMTTGHFTSLSALGEYLNDTHKAQIIEGKPSDNQYLRCDYTAHDWTGNQSLDDSIATLESGGYWPEGTADLQKISINPDAVDSLKEIVKRKFVRSVAGGGLSVGEYLSGNPDCMRRPFKQPVEQRVVTIETSAFLSCSVRESSLLNVGRAILALIDVLESHGVSVELNHRLCVVDSDHKARALDATVSLKQAGEGWSASSIAYALTHPAMFRAATFRMVEASDNAYPLKNGMGHPDSIARFIKQTSRTADLAFPPLHAKDQRTHYSSPEKALAFIMGQLEEQSPNLLAA